MCHPVKMSTVHDRTADCGAMTIHVFCGGVGDNIRAPFDRPQVHRCRECIVHDQRDPVTMCSCRELLNIKHRQRRVGDGLAEHQLRLRPERRIQLFIGCIRRYEGRLDPHLRHRNLDQVIGPAIDGRGRHNMSAALADIEDRKKVRRLSRRSQHTRASAFHRSDLGRHMVTGRILQTGIEITRCFQVKQFSHILTGVIFECGGLDDRNLARSAILRCISSLYTGCTDLELIHSGCLLLSLPVMITFCSQLCHQIILLLSPASRYNNRASWHSLWKWTALCSFTIMKTDSSFTRSIRFRSRRRCP